MRKEIKTRVLRKDIKILDKVLVGTERIKRANMHTKDLTENPESPEQRMPVLYAENKVTQATRSTAHKIGHQIRKETGQSIIPIRKGAVKVSGRKIKTTEQVVKTPIVPNQSQPRLHSLKSVQKTKTTFRRNVEIAVQKTKALFTTSAATVKTLATASKTLISFLLSGGWIAVFILIIVVLFGGALSKTGGGNLNGVLPVSAEVEAYSVLIQHYAKQYGIGDYVALIKAVMMQESGGRGLDPMQASESGYNTKYPRQVGGIQEPEYSIDCGIQTLKDCLETAEVESPVDMENIKLALQGYNYGKGYISWAREHGGGYSPANAVEYSEMMTERMGWDSYGDKEYVPHVLRYYPFGRVPAGMGSNAIVEVALSQEGNGGDTYWSWYGFGKKVEWCACFVSWCANQCGYIEEGTFPKFSLCTEGVKWFEQRGQFKDKSYVPATGDIIFFDWAGDGKVDHAGIVEKVVDGTIHTIEGNSGDKVKRRSYSIGKTSIYGYGIY